MQVSNSMGNMTQRFMLAINSAEHHAAALPKEAATEAAGLTKVNAQIAAEHATQQRAKEQVATLAARLSTSLEAGSVEQAKLLRYAEVAYGPRSPKLLEFRSKTEGKVVKRSPRKKAAAPATQPAKTEAAAQESGEGAAQESGQGAAQESGQGAAQAPVTPAPAATPPAVTNGVAVPA